MIIPPAFTAQQDMNARDTVTNTRFGDLFDSRSDCPIIARSLQLEIKKRAGGQANTAARLFDTR
jgi:hypothetical protein